MVLEDREKLYFVFNVSLGIIAVILILVLFNVHLPSVGTAVGFLSAEEPYCSVAVHGRITPMSNLEECCLQAREQLKCEFNQREFEGMVFSWRCFTGKDSAEYLMS